MQKVYSLICRQINSTKAFLKCRLQQSRLSMCTRSFKETNYSDIYNNQPMVFIFQTIKERRTFHKQLFHEQTINELYKEIKCGVICQSLIHFFFSQTVLLQGEKVRSLNFCIFFQVCGTIIIKLFGSQEGVLRFKIIPRP